MLNTLRKLYRFVRQQKKLLIVSLKEAYNRPKYKALFEKSALNTEDPVIFFSCPDIPSATGGIKYLYKHVDTLNENGFRAAILHKCMGFRCAYFDNKTLVAYKGTFAYKANDYLVLPEIFGPHLDKIEPTVNKIILNQNAFYTFNGYPTTTEKTHSAYIDGDIKAVLCTSKHIYDSIKFIFSEAKVFKTTLGVDTSVFKYSSKKENIIAYMPRKASGDIANIINILKYRNSEILKNFEFVAIENKTEFEVAEILQKAQFFLSFSDREGFGLPPAEAMACGCVVVGYHGWGGLEFFKKEFSYPVAPSDVFTYAAKLEEVLIENTTSKQKFIDMGLNASKYIQNNYSIENQTKSIISFWQTIFSDSKT